MFCHQCGHQCPNGAAFCEKCGTSLRPSSSGGDRGSAGMDAAINGNGPGVEATVVYAGFWRRYLALFLDQLVLGIPLLLILVAAGFSLGWFNASQPGHALGLQGMFYLAYFVAALFYYGLQESSTHQATVGKRVLGIKVTDLDGQRLTFSKAVARWVASSLSYLTLYVGFIMAAFTRRKQALHDMVASTLVVDRWAFTEQPERQRTELSGCLIAFLIIVVLGIPVLGILAAIAIPAYQDYTIRAHVAESVNTGASAKLEVADWFAKNHRCPVNGEAGLSAPTSYAGPHVVSMSAGHMENGHCALEIVVKGAARPDINGKRIWLELDDSRPNGSWKCSSEIPDRYLPTSCRNGT
jgi:uncharacterized RDD family membrane protein YckC/Tfp pilus assembly major pilin PilA